MVLCVMNDNKISKTNMELPILAFQQVQAQYRHEVQE